MKYTIVFLLFAHFAQAQDCTPRDFERLMAEAKSLARNGEYDMAINKLQSAKTCQPQREAEVNKKILQVFEQVNSERKRAEDQTKKAETEARRIYANDLAFKSETVLNNGDRTTAFKLAEFAYQYVDTTNTNVLHALMQALYKNDDSDSPFLPWCTHTLIEYPQDIYSTSIRNIALSPDGKLLVIEYLENDTIKIFNLETGAKLQTIIPDCMSPALTFASNGYNLAVACDEKTINIWDLKEQKVVYEITSNTAPITEIAISHDDCHIAAAFKDSTVLIWNMETGSVEKMLPNQHAGVFQLVFSKSDDLISFVLTDNTVKIWSLTENKEILSIGNCASVFQNMDFSSDDTLFAVIADNYAVEIWDITTKSRLQTLPIYMTASCLLFLPDQPLLAVGDFDNNINIWNLQSKKVVQSLTGHSSPIIKIALTTKGDKLASSDFSTVKIWELDSLTALQIFKGHNSSISSVSASRSQNWIASGSEDNTAKIWDIATMKMIHDFTELNSTVNHVVFSPDGKYLAITTYLDSFVRVWNAEDEKIITIVTSEPSFPFVAFSPDSKLIAVQGPLNSILLVKLKTNKIVDTIQLTDTPFSIDFSNNGQYLAIGALEGSVNIWDLRSRRLRWTKAGHKLVVTDIKFIPGDTSVASASGDGNIKIWETKSGRVIQTLSGHAQVVNNIDVSPNGTRLVSGSLDGSLMLWNLSDGTPIYTFHKPTSSYVMDVAFLSEGKRVAFGCDDKLIKLMELDGAYLIHRSRSIDTNEFHVRQLAPITMPQILAYKIQDILDVRPQNEQILLATHDTWQIAAFADLYTQKIAQTGFPKKADYDRALRLYNACLSHNTDNTFFQQKISDLERLWREKNN